MQNRINFKSLLTAEVFGDRVIATAVLDRILHHAITMNIRGNSYRLKDKLKAGLVRPAETPSVE
jgi:DNA replication protein DnaC